MSTKSKSKLKLVSEAYRIPTQAVKELRKVIEYNDSCDQPEERVTRQEVLMLLADYGWTGSVHSLNRLLKAHFGRSLTGANTNG